MQYAFCIVHSHALCVASPDADQRFNGSNGFKWLKGLNGSNGPVLDANGKLAGPEWFRYVSHASNRNH